MAIPVFDHTLPLDLRGLEIREVEGGAREAYCKCGGWLRLNAYKGDPMVIRQLNHIPRCAHYETMLKNGEML